MPLAEAYLEDLGRTMARPAAGVSRAAREWMLGYRWPGNVRELRNAIERAILMCDGGLITPDHLPAPLALPERTPATNGSSNGSTNGSPNGSSNGSGHGVPMPSAPESVDLAIMERGFIERALDQAKGNKSKAARLLGLSRAQLYWRLDKHGLR